MVEELGAKPSAKKTIPVMEGLFTMPDSPEGFRLIGSKCRHCGTGAFPKRKRCTRCFSDEVDQILLNPQGKVASWSIVRMRPIEYKGNVPYVLSIIDMPEGLQLRAQLSGISIDNPEIHIGDTVEVMPEIIDRDENGNDILSFKFKRV